MPGRSMSVNRRVRVKPEPCAGTAPDLRLVWDRDSDVETTLQRQQDPGDRVTGVPSIMIMLGRIIRPTQKAAAPHGPAGARMR